MSVALSKWVCFKWKRFESSLLSNTANRQTGITHDTKCTFSLVLFIAFFLAKTYCLMQNSSADSHYYHSVCCPMPWYNSGHPDVDRLGSREIWAILNPTFHVGLTSVVLLVNSVQYKHSYHNLYAPKRAFIMTIFKLNGLFKTFIVTALKVYTIYLTVILKPCIYIYIPICIY